MAGLPSACSLEHTFVNLNSNELPYFAMLIFHISQQQPSLCVPLSFPEKLIHFVEDTACESA